MTTDAKCNEYCWGDWHYHLNTGESCKNCGAPILLGPPTPDVYWFHPKGQSVYCDETHTIRAEPV